MLRRKAVFSEWREWQKSIPGRIRSLQTNDGTYGTVVWIGHWLAPHFNMTNRLRNQAVSTLRFVILADG